MLGIGKARRQLIVGTLGVASLAGLAIFRSKTAQVVAPTPAAAPTSLPSNPNSQLNNAELAKQRCQEIVQTLEAAGYTVAEGNFSPKPLMINNKPAFAIIVGDIHTKRFEQPIREIVKGIGQRYHVSSLFLEGSMASNEKQAVASKALKDFDGTIARTIISAETAKDLNVTTTGLSSGYSLPNYHGLGFKHEIGLESTDVKKYLLSNLLTLYKLAVDETVADVEKKGQLVLLVDGHPIDSIGANLFCCPDPLRQLLGDKFPMLTMTGMAEVDFRDAPGNHKGTALTNKSLPVLKEHQRQIDSLWVKHCLSERNAIFAANLRVHFANMSTADMVEDKNNDPSVVLVTVGLAHALSSENTIPATTDYLSALGISSVTVLPAKPGELKIAVNKEGVIVINDSVPTKPGEK